MNILLPVDGSVLSLEAVRHAIRLAKSGLKAGVVLGNVQEPSSLYEMVVVHDADKLARMAVEAGQHVVADAAALLNEADIEHEVEIVVGQPAHGLLDMIERFEIDTVIMGAHGEGRSDAALGSVAHELLRHARAPVMIVRPRPEPEAEPDELAANSPE